MLEQQRDRYLSHLSIERGLARNTVEAYRRDLTRYVDYLKSHGLASVAAVTRENLESFVHDLALGSGDHAGLSATSVNRTTVAVRGWHRFAVDEGWVEDDVADAIRPRSTPSRLPKALSVDAVKRLIDVVSTGDGESALRDAALIEVLYATGARISEAIGIDVDDIALDDFPAVVLTGKGNKQRVVPVGSLAAQALGAYLVRARPALVSKGRGTAALFVGSRGTRLTRQAAWGIVRTAAERAGIDGVSPHALRHSFATHLLNGGADVRVVQELLGHASVSTTQVYTLVTQQSLREVYAMAHPRARDARSGGSVGA